MGRAAVITKIAEGDLERSAKSLAGGRAYITLWHSPESSQAGASFVSATFWVETGEHAHILRFALRVIAIGFAIAIVVHTTAKEGGSETRELFGAP